MPLSHLLKPTRRQVLAVATGVAAMAPGAQPEITCHEMIQTAADGQQRGRTWLWYRNGALDRYTLIDERRVAEDSPLA